MDPKGAEVLFIVTVDCSGANDSWAWSKTDDPL